MRFCVECGNTLAGGPSAQAGGPSAQAGGPSAQASGLAAQAPPASAPDPAPPITADTLASAVERAAGGPICSRCRGVGDAGTEFCKFCGARYGDGGPDVGAFGSTAPAGGPKATIAEVVGPPPREATARIVSVRKDGSDGTSYALAGEQVDVGAREGDIVLRDDPYLSPRHARLRAYPDGWRLVDLDSLNGVYVRLRQPAELRDGDTILLGQQVLRFEVFGEEEAPLGPARARGVMVFGTPEVARVARLVQYTTEGLGRDVHSLYRGETVLGRENGDIVFTDDPFLSRRHASVRIEGTSGLDSAKGMGAGRRRFTLVDLGSSNGTALRIRTEHRLAEGDLFRVGRHLFRFEATGGQA